MSGARMIYIDNNLYRHWQDDTYQTRWQVLIEYDTNLSRWVDCTMEIMDDGSVRPCIEPLKTKGER